MIKLSITLPNSAQLSIEADEPDMIREVLGFTLPAIGDGCQRFGGRQRGN